LIAGSGLGQPPNVIRKIVGPLSLALISNSSNIVSPQHIVSPQADAVLPAYLFLALCMLFVGLSFVFLEVRPPEHCTVLDSRQGWR